MQNEQVQENITVVQNTETVVQANQTEVQKIETVVQNSKSTVQNNETSPSPAEINAKNAAQSTGRVADDGGSAVFFTAEQVRAMTPAQVRANYPRIIESMKCRTFFG